MCLQMCLEPFDERKGQKRGPKERDKRVGLKRVSSERA